MLFCKYDTLLKVTDLLQITNTINGDTPGDNICTAVYGNMQIC